MAIRAGSSLVRENVSRDVHVVRLVRADLREQLDDDGAGGALFRELRDDVLNGLGENQTLILNLGLVELFPTALYACLLRVREAVLARRARLVLCRLSPEHLEIFQLFNARRLFHTARTEAQAISEAGARPAGFGGCYRAPGV
jgi:anti-anti-sigma regulatory factor